MEKLKALAPLPQVTRKEMEKLEAGERINLPVSHVPEKEIGRGFAVRADGQGTQTLQVTVVDRKRNGKGTPTYVVIERLKPSPW